MCDFEVEVLLMFVDFGIGFVFFSLFGKGFLMGIVDILMIFVEGDICICVLWFEVDNFDVN